MEGAAHQQSRAKNSTQEGQFLEKTCNSMRERQHGLQKWNQARHVSKMGYIWPMEVFKSRLEI